ncbi:hypothetical protein TRICI_002698 [Trichomonascus ciferrii]|uniref:FAD dependent oxidoreductase domain-containing protein n=1 Tax=Trichomonascus ciferrii TaxID=44093 RepID=A0A642VB31_9ASCO|nr:hypothetical protein TRICI_002698 [Trichomonascus ciferrii]
MGKSVIIVGAGVFGLSTALELSRTVDQHEYDNITILDRAMPPVTGGASVDINRIMRPDYADPVYSSMGLEVLKEWQTNPLYRDHFYQSHIMFIAKDNADFRETSQGNLREFGIELKPVKNANDAKKLYPAFDGPLTTAHGYAHENAGWVNAEGAVRSTVGEILRLGKAKFITGEDGTMTELIIENNAVKGVMTASGKVHTADLVVMATGPWTPSLIDCEDNCVAAAQPVAFLQLTPEETRKYSSIPVYLNIDSGFFVFPPTKDGVLKCARHCFGYTNTVARSWGKVSKPLDKPIVSELPEDALKVLREGLKDVFNEDIAKRPFFESRICWYTDTPSGDFTLGYHPKYENLFMCTTGSGHGFKFLPILGKYSTGALFKRLDKKLLDKFSWKTARVTDEMQGDGSRLGAGRQELKKLESRL